MADVSAAHAEVRAIDIVGKRTRLLSSGLSAHIAIARRRNYMTKALRRKRVKDRTTETEIGRVSAQHASVSREDSWV
jgi:hypothetical protein